MSVSPSLVTFLLFDAWLNGSLCDVVEVLVNVVFGGPPLVELLLEDDELLEDMEDEKVSQRGKASVVDTIIVNPMTIIDRSIFFL